MKTPEQFMDFFRTNYPGPNTIITLPDWHAPKIYAAAIHASAHRDLLDACKKVLYLFDHLENDLAPDDPLKEIREKFHAPYRAVLIAAIQKAEGAQ